GDGIGGNQNRIAIGWTPGSSLDADVAVGAGLVLDDDLLLQAARQILADEAGGHRGRNAPGGRRREGKRAGRAPPRPPCPGGRAGSATPAPSGRGWRGGEPGTRRQSATSPLENGPALRMAHRLSYRSFSAPASGDAAIEVPSCRSPPISPSTWARFGSRHPGPLSPARTPS